MPLKITEAREKVLPPQRRGRYPPSRVPIQRKIRISFLVIAQVFLSFSIVCLVVKRKEVRGRIGLLSLGIFTKIKPSSVLLNRVKNSCRVALLGGILKQTF
jgi:hypothetical protein